MPGEREYQEPPEGWFDFGTHVDKPVRLEFSSQLGEDGLPLWERPMGFGVTSAS